jgi:hypothetical protein
MAPEVRAVPCDPHGSAVADPPVRLGAAVLLPLPQTPSHALIQPHPRAGGRGTEVSGYLNLVMIAPFLCVAYSRPRSAGYRCATAPICDLCNRDCVNELTKIKSSTICSIK